MTVVSDFVGQGRGKPEDFLERNRLGWFRRLSRPNCARELCKKRVPWLAPSGGKRAVALGFCSFDCLLIDAVVRQRYGSHAKGGPR